MKYTLITLTCPSECGVELPLELPSQRIEEFKEQASVEDTTLEALVRERLQQGHGQCAYCGTDYAVEIGSTVKKTGNGEAISGP